MILTSYPSIENLLDVWEGFPEVALLSLKKKDRQFPRAYQTKDGGTVMCLLSSDGESTVSIYRPDGTAIQLFRDPVTGAWQAPSGTPVSANWNAERRWAALLRFCGDNHQPVIRAVLEESLPTPVVESAFAVLLQVLREIQHLPRSKCSDRRKILSEAASLQWSVIALLLGAGGQEAAAA